MASEKLIKHMVDRFLGWRLPDDFRPDAGISFKPEFNEGSAYPMRHQPSGTNLFDATQSEEMVRYMLEGLPGNIAMVDAGEVRGWQPIETAPKDGTEIDLWRDGERWCNWWWSKGHKAWIRKHSYPIVTSVMSDPQPTHWMPLPAAPGQPQPDTIPVPADVWKQVVEATEVSLNYIQNSEAEFGIRLNSGDRLRQALAAAKSVGVGS